MKILMSLLITLGITISTATGQVGEKEVYPKQASVNHNEAVKNFSKGFVSNSWGGALFDNAGLGSNFIKTATINVLGSDNISILSQYGYGITGVINVQGNHNETSLNQVGTDLRSILNIKGSYNEFNMDQFGHGLSNFVNVSGSGLQFDARQTNYGFEMSQQGVHSIPLSIQQRGRTIPITIKNN